MSLAAVVLASTRTQVADFLEALVGQPCEEIADPSGVDGGDVGIAAVANSFDMQGSVPD